MWVSDQTGTAAGGTGIKIMFICAGFFLGRSWVERDPGYAIAAGLFAIAEHMGG